MAAYREGACRRRTRRLSLAGCQLYLDATAASPVSRDLDAAKGAAALCLAASQLMHVGRINPDFLDEDTGVGALIGQVSKELGAIVRCVASEIHGQGIGSRAGSHD